MIVEKSNKTRQNFRNYGLLMIILLSIEYILGMINNLYVQFPKTGTEGQMWEFAWKQYSIGTHIILGLILLLTGAFLFIQRIRFGVRSWIIMSGLGLIAILAAGFGGAMFINTQEDIYSFTMSIAFLIALLINVWGIILSYTNN